MSDVFGGDSAAGQQVETGAEKPLTDQERALLQRLLSDPFSYPQQFKTWLVAYLEGSDMVLARSSVQGLNDLLGAGSAGSGIFGLLPPGMIFPYAGAAPPPGTVLCDGTAYARVGTYANLFSVIGTLYGAGDGSTTFNVPDLKRRLPFGAGAGIGQGANEGKVEASRHIDHHHDINQTTGSVGNHQHGYSGATGSAGDHSHQGGSGEGASMAYASGASAALGSGGTSRFIVSDWGALNTTGAHQHPFSGATDAQGSHNHVLSGPTSGGFESNHPAYLAIGFIINY